jgi:hypothetical protein
MGRSCSMWTWSGNTVNSIDNIAAGVAIAWGAWTTLKNE